MAAPTRKFSTAARARGRLADPVALGRFRRGHGEILDSDAWLKVLANALAAVPPKERPPRNGTAPPAVYLDLRDSTLASHAARCCVEADFDQVRAQVAATKDWLRTRRRDGKKLRVMMRMDEIGRLLGITEEERLALKIYSLGTMDGSPAKRARAKRERDREHKETVRWLQGARPRDVYERQSRAFRGSSLGRKRASVAGRWRRNVAR